MFDRLKLIDKKCMYLYYWLIRKKWKFYANSWFLVKPQKFFKVFSDFGIQSN